MTTLSATAVITAHDRASAVFARVGANARALSGRFASATGGIARFGQAAAAAAMNLGVPAAMAGAMAARGEYEIDKMARVMQAAGELSDQQRKMLTDKAFDVSRATGESAAEILKGQRELILGGLDADTAAATSSIIAKVARANEMAGGRVAEDAITNASALGLAMGSTEEKVASLTKTLDFMSTVPAFSPMNWQDLSTAMKYAGPVAGALKVPMKDLGAALSMLAFAGFKGEEAGTALRTILTRLIAPTKAARNELRAAGIDQAQIFNFDAGKANDKASLLDALKQQGLMTEAERQAADAALRGVTFDGTNAADYTDRMNEVLQRVLGLGRGDSQDKEILKKAIDNHLLRAVGDLDMEKVFMSFKDLPVKALKEMFGLQRISQAKALASKISEIVKLPNGERVSAWRKLSDEIGGAIDGASDRKAGPVMDGFSASIDRVKTALEGMRHQVFNSGFGDELASVFGRMAQSVNDLARTDPARLRQIGWGIAGLMVAPAAGFAVSGLASLGSGLTSLAGGLRDLGLVFMRTPLLNKLLIGGGIAGLFLGLDNLGALFGQDETAANGAILSRRVSPVMELVTALKGLGGETFAAIGDVSARLTELANALKDLVGLDPNTSILGMGFSALAKTIETITAGLREMRAVINGKAPNPSDSMKNGSVFSYLFPALAGLDTATGNTGQAKPFGWLYGDTKDAAYNVKLRRERYQRDLAGGPDAPPNLPSILRQFPDAGRQRVEGQANVTVQGQVQGTVTLDARIQVDGGGRVSEQTTGGGAVSGKLDPGESTMDLGAP